MPAPSELVVHFAVLAFPVPVRLIEPQAPIELAPSLKLTVPVGDQPFTVAVNVTLPPAVDGVSEVARLVVLVNLSTVSDSTVLVEVALVVSPLYLAVMLRVPVARPLVVQLAVRVSPLPARSAAVQPLIETVPSLKVTVPVGATPLTVAVKVTLEPTTIGVADVTTLAAVTALLIVCVRVELVDALFDASPLYATTIACVPAASELVVQAAVRVLPAPDKATAAQPAIELPPSVKLTVPVGP